MKNLKFNNPRVTIVIPVYNGAEYVKYAIDSAVAQDYDNLEVLVVDDGSTDSTGQIAKSYGSKIRYIKKENGGVSSALNLALKKMTGEYFSWLSHDDTYEPNKISREIEFLRKNNFVGKKVIVFSDYYLIDKNGKLISEQKKDHEEIERKPEYSLLKGHINGLSLLIPKRAFDDYGEFDTTLVCTQDYEMWRRMFKTYKFLHIPETLVSTRWHKKQTTQTSPKVVTEGNKFYYEMLTSIPEQRMEELEGSKYNLLVEMAEFFNNSSYQEFSDKCKKEAEEILEKVNLEKENKKVSVIIPFYNRPTETERAIKSVLAQTYKNIEIILVNDGSTENIDNIKKIAKEKKLVLIDGKENKGASEARNMGIKAAKGDFIAFLDSDDEFEKEKVEVQLKYMLAAKGHLSHTSYIRLKDGKREYMNSGVRHGQRVKSLVDNCVIATPTVMIDAEWLRKKKILFDVTINFGEDTRFWLELLKGNETYLLGIDKPLSVVYTNGDSAIVNGEKQIEGLKGLIKYLLNDEYYAQFDIEIAHLMEAYAHYVKKYRPLEPVMDGSALQKFLFFIRQEGIVLTSKRITKKIKNMMNPND